jgi:hypothetical protein
VQANIFDRSLLFAAATEMIALGFVTGAAPAQAAPEACSQYAFNGQQFLISGANIGEVVVDAGTGTTIVGEASTFGDDGRAVRGWVRDGGIQGRDINFSISWIEPSDTVWTFKGTVADDGLVHRGLMHGPGFMGLWDSSSPLACNDPVVATKPLPDDNITPPVPATTRVPGPVTAP